MAGWLWCILVGQPGKSVADLMAAEPEVTARSEPTKTVTGLSWRAVDVPSQDGANHKAFSHGVVTARAPI